jgi:uncharacterized protein
MSLKLVQDEAPWYKEGLRFKCTGCGRCCTGSPGFVWITEEEIKTAAEYLKISPREFSIKYIRRLENKMSLVEHSKTYDCVFLKENRCQIYSVRPKQCRTFPWWTQHLKSKECWEAESQYCEGINHPDAPVIPYETIQEQLDLHEGKK